MSKTPELTQADLDKALQHAIRHCHWHGEGQKPRWSVVMDVTGHGSTYAAMLCRWAGGTASKELRRLAMLRCPPAPLLLG